MPPALPQVQPSSRYKEDRQAGLRQGIDVSPNEYVHHWDFTCLPTEIIARLLERPRSLVFLTIECHQAIRKLIRVELAMTKLGKPGAPELPTRSRLNRKRSLPRLV